MLDGLRTQNAFSLVHPRTMALPGFTWSDNASPPFMPPSVSTRWLASDLPGTYTPRLELHGAALTCLVIAASYHQSENLFSKPKFARFFATFRVILLETIMARKLTPAADRRAPEWKGFLERRLSDLELEECDGWKPKPNEIWELVEAMTQAGYKVQLTWSGKTGLATCTLTDQDPTRSTAGYAVSTQDENCALALKAALFKHHTILQRDWGPLLGAPAKGKRG